MKLADISKYQGDIDFTKTNVDGFIIRGAYRAYGNGIIYKDLKAERNIAECEEREIPYGLYFYSQAINSNEAIQEAMYLVNMANKTNNCLFLALDMELTGSGRGRADFLTPRTRQLIADTFRKAVTDAGYQPFIYSNESYWEANLDYNSPKYMNWVANWSKEPTIPYEIWQYTNKGSIPGIEKIVDLNKSELTIDDFTGKDTTYRIFKEIKNEIKKIGDLVTYLEEKIK